MAEAILRVQRQATDFGQSVRRLRGDVDALAAQLDAVDPRLASSLRTLEAYQQRLRTGGRLSQEEIDRMKEAAGTLGSATPAMRTAIRTAPQEQSTAAQGAYSGLRDYLAAVRYPTTNAETAAPRRAAPTETDPAARRPAAQVAVDLGERQRALGGVRPVAEDVTHAAERAQQAFQGMGDREFKAYWTATQRELRATTEEMIRLERGADRIRLAKRAATAEEVSELRRMEDATFDLGEQREALENRRAAATSEATRRKMHPIGDYLYGGGEQRPSALRQGIGDFMSGAGIGGGSMGGAIAGAALGRMAWAQALPLLAGMAAAWTVREGQQSYDAYLGRLRRAEVFQRTAGIGGDDMIRSVARDANRYKVFSPDDIMAGTSGLIRGVGREGRHGQDRMLQMAAITGQSPAEMAAQMVQLSRMNQRVDLSLAGKVLGEFGESAVPEDVEPAQNRRWVRGRRQEIRERLKLLNAKDREGTTPDTDAPRSRLDTIAGAMSGEFFTDTPPRKPGFNVIPVDPRFSAMGRGTSGGFEAVDPGKAATERRALVEELRNLKTMKASPLPYDTSLFPEFLQKVTQLGGAMQAPLTRPSIAGLSAQLREATGLKFAGIEAGGIHGLETGAEAIQGIHGAIGGAPRGGAMDDARVLGIMRLRRQPEVVAKLAAQDIDINTIPGIMRAMERAPELATEGIPEVSQAMFGGMRGLFGRPDMLEMALRGERGASGEVAHLMATRPEAVDKIMSATPRAGGEDKRFADAAAAALQSPEADKLWQKYLRIEIKELELGAAIGERIGPLLTEKYNDFKIGVIQTIEQLFETHINVDSTPREVQ